MTKKSQHIIKNDVRLKNNEFLILQGNICFNIIQVLKNNKDHQHSEKLFGVFWLHSHFLQNNTQHSNNTDTEIYRQIKKNNEQLQTIRLYKKDIDIIYKDKKHDKLPRDFFVEIGYKM